LPVRQSARHTCAIGGLIACVRVAATAGVSAISASAIVLTSAGCAVGPDYKPPPPPAVTSLSPTPIHISRAGGPAQQAYVRGLALPQRWWELFHCSSLNAVVARAIDGNPDLQAAQAALRAADANTQAARGSFFPQIGASVNASSQRPDPTRAPGTSKSPYTVASAEVSVSYVLDVFGLNGRRVESLAAQAEGQHFELQATYLTLTSKLALAAIEEASLREEIGSAEQSIAIAKEVLGVLKKHLEAHEATLLDVSGQEVALAQFQQTLLALQKRLLTNRDLITALTGRFAGDGLEERFEFACLRLPANLPLSLPSSIVQDRPDVRAAEANMHAATAEVGVAVASRLPQLNLSASAGASAVAKLASVSSPLLLWSIIGSAAQTLFDGMSAEQRQRAAEAGLDRAAALYRRTLIEAFQDIADVLQAIDVDHKAFVATEQGVRAAQTNLDMTRRLLKQGLASALQLLSAQQNYAQAKSAHARAKAARLANTVLLFQALGGGLGKGNSRRNGQKAARWVGRVTKVANKKAQ
jgi:NodT family efflux transporter outer membrane factor (OMF) lipoprotein